LGPPNPIPLKIIKDKTCTHYVRTAHYADRTEQSPQHRTQDCCGVGTNRCGFEKLPNRTPNQKFWLRPCMWTLLVHLRDWAIPCYLKRMLLLSEGSKLMRSIAMLMALALVRALKSSYEAFHGARKPILKCSGFCCCARVVAMTTVAKTTTADSVVIVAVAMHRRLLWYRQSAPAKQNRANFAHDDWCRRLGNLVSVKRI